MSDSGESADDFSWSEVFAEYVRLMGEVEGFLAAAVQHDEFGQRYLTFWTPATDFADYQSKPGTPERRGFAHWQQVLDAQWRLQQWMAKQRTVLVEVRNYGACDKRKVREILGGLGQETEVKYGPAWRDETPRGQVPEHDRV